MTFDSERRQRSGKVTRLFNEQNVFDGWSGSGALCDRTIKLNGVLFLLEVQP